MAEVDGVDGRGMDLDVDDATWLMRRLDEAKPWLSRGHGTFAVAIHVDGDGPRVVASAWRDVAPATSEPLRLALAGLTHDDLTQLAGVGGAVTLRELAQRRPALREGFRDIARAGYRGVLFVVGPSPGDDVIVLGALNRAPLHLSNQARSRFDTTVSDLAAVFATRRALQRATPSARDLGPLRDAARAHDDAAAPAEPMAVSALWDQISAGRLHVVDHHDHDGRRYLVAIEGANAGPPLDELQVEAISMLADGYTQKEIADALAISPATVSRRLAAALSTMGLRSTAEAVALFGPTLETDT